jgi:hypothetical protein
MGMIWKSTHLSIKGLTAENAYQSKNQVVRSKYLPIELGDRDVLRRIRGRKEICLG